MGNHNLFEQRFVILGHEPHCTSQSALEHSTSIDLIEYDRLLTIPAQEGDLITIEDSVVEHFKLPHPVRQEPCFKARQPYIGYQISIKVIMPRFFSRFEQKSRDLLSIFRLINF